jgi:hypothetical protein
VTAAASVERILALFRDLSSGRRFSAAESVAFDDSRLHRAVRLHGLAPLAFAHGLSSFRDEYRASALDARAREKIAAQAFDALAAGGIRAAAIKGSAVAYTSYEEPALRPMSDLDLLVPPAEFERAARALEGLGYRRTLDPELSFATSSTMTFERTGGGEPIDLHASVLHPLRSGVDWSEVWRRARPGFGPFASAWTLEPLDQALIHFAHAAKHELAVPLVSYLDGVRFLGGLDGKGRKTLAARAREGRLGRAVAAAIQATEALRDGTEVRSRLLPSVRELARRREASRLQSLLRRVSLAEGPRELFGLAILAWRRHTAHADANQPTA